jgi:hypothetical protein
VLDCWPGAADESNTQLQAAARSPQPAARSSNGAVFWPGGAREEKVRWARADGQRLGHLPLMPRVGGELRGSAVREGKRRPTSVGRRCRPCI